MNRQTNDHFRKNSQSNKGLIMTIGTIIIGLLLVILILVIAGNSQEAKKQTQASKSSRATTSVKTSSAKEKTTPIRISNGTASLAAFSDNAVEDPETRTNGGDVTYSQFYYDHGNRRWYWLFSSSKRGQIENAMVSRVVKNGSDYLVYLTSELYQPGTRYHLDVNWLNHTHTMYRVNTAFKNISGNYTIGDAALADYGQTYDASTTVTANDWLKATVVGDNEEMSETRTNGGEVTDSDFSKIDGNWYWTLTGSKQGTIVEAQITSGSISDDTRVAHLNATSLGYPNFHQHFTLSVTMADSGSYYIVQSNFKNGIYGKYRID
jgi:type II secretory pathway pseudopilin PulG